MIKDKNTTFKRYLCCLLLKSQNYQRRLWMLSPSYTEILESEIVFSDQENINYWTEPNSKLLKSHSDRPLTAVNSYFRSIERLGESSYVPTDQEILYAWVVTRGIAEHTFVASGQRVVVYDVGGIRSERNKWIDCFEDVGALLFTVDIACWDQLLFEDETVNRMQEALILFDDTINSIRFFSTETALIFTKCDKLAAKLKTTPMKKFFPDFEGGDDLQNARAYITDRFISLNQHSDKNISIYYTSIADDEKSLGKVAVNFW